MDELQENYEEKDKDQNPQFIEGFALSGIEVKGKSDKKFEILSAPTYEVFKDGEDVKRRLCFNILFNKQEVKYYPNKTSQSKIVAIKGRELQSWIGHKGEFEVLSQKIGKDIKEVIYIK